MGNPIWGVIKSKSPLLGVIKGVYDVISAFFRLNFKVLFIAAFWAFFCRFWELNSNKYRLFEEKVKLTNIMTSQLAMTFHAIGSKSTSVITNLDITNFG